MNKGLTFFSALLIALAAAQPGMADAGKVTVKMTGFKNADGIVRTVLVNNEQDYLKEAGQEGGSSAELKVNSDMTAEHSFENVEYGKYAVKIYHDVNNNNKLDKNMVGMPREPYGLSNNARGKLGLPAFSTVTFDVNAPEQVIEIQIK